MEPLILILGLILLLLIVWGLGAPVPEESVLLLAAVLAQSGNYWGIVLTCTLGIAAADTLAYARGRARSRVFTPFSSGKRFIAGAGVFAMFTARILISVRTVVPFMAGAMRMPRWKFHSASVLGAFVSSAVIVRTGMWLYSQLPAQYAPILWAALLTIITGLLVMYATRAQAHLLRASEREGAVSTAAGSTAAPSKQSNNHTPANNHANRQTNNHSNHKKAK